MTTPVSPAEGHVPDPVPDPASGTTSGSVERDGVSSGGGGRRRGFGVVPGLDGIRAVAVVLVLLFHQGFPWASGGFLGVSVFFTLSGYLITSLLIAERTSTGGVGLVAFWRRRFRRLLPASLVCMGLVIAFGILAADPTQRAELAGDITASLAYVANWWFLASGQSYADLFTAPSPLLHFWSLAIEEQFYLLLPLAAWAALTRTRAPIRTLTIGTLTALAATIAIPLAIGVSNDWYYYATPTRTPELLTGVLLALLLTRTHKTATNTTTTTTATGTGTSTLRDRLTTNPTPATTTLLTIGGIAALGTTLWLTTTTTTTSPWLYDGGLPAFSLISAILITATHLPNNPLTHLLTLKPIRHIGHISYGIYLFHWPIFLWLTPTTTGLTDWPLFTLRITATLTLAELSYHLIEQPIRRNGLAAIRRRVGRFAPPAVALATIAAVLLGGIAVSTTAPPPANDFAAAERRLAAGSTQGTGPTGPTADPLTSTETPTGPPRIGVFGDSTALMMGIGLEEWFAETGRGTIVPGSAVIGCGIARSGERRLRSVDVEPVPQRCTAWPGYWRQQVRASAPEVAVVQIGPWDVMTRSDPNSGSFVAPGDAAWDDLMRADLLAAVDTLNDEGTFVVWLTTPLPNANLDPTTHFAGPESVDPDRFRRLNDLIAELPTLRPDGVAVVDTAAFFAGRADDLRLRPDGSHLADTTAVEAARVIGPQVLDTIEAARSAGRIATLRAAAAGRHTPPPLRARAPDEPMRVLVWTDDRSEEVRTAVEAALPLVDVPVEVSYVSFPPGCGLTPGVSRRFLDGTTLTTPADCDGGRRFTDALAATEPHLVLLGPGGYERGSHHFFPDERETFWFALDDGFTSIWIQTSLGDAADRARSSGALVGILPTPATLGGAEVDYLESYLDVVRSSPRRISWMGPAAGPGTRLPDVVASHLRWSDQLSTAAPTEPA